MIYKWQIFEKIKCPNVFNGNFDKLALSRWYKNKKEAELDWKKVYSLNKHNPFLMNDMDKFVNRVAYHIKNRTKILVFWDYDVDGISAASVMLKWLHYMGVKEENLSVVIPNRVIWYSIKKEYIIEELENWLEKPDLIITVDCWIRSGKDIDYIVNQLWIEVIVTDHHAVEENDLPLSASAMINPHRKWSQYPFQEISWSLVSLKCIEALNTQLRFIDWPNWNPNEAIRELEEIAMLWTVADVMPIQNENRWLVKETLIRLSNSKNIWLLVLTNELRKKYRASNDDNDYNTDFIWWSIWPRINAAWRIDNPYLPLQMLLTSDVEEAWILFKSLDNTNKTRQELVKWDYDKAKKEADTSNNWILYINEQLADGVIWLIAWRLKEDYYLPTIVLWARNNNTWVYKWSCRSIPWLNIYEALTDINNYYIENISKNIEEPLMLWFGWHPLAAWLSLKEENISEFERLFTEYCNQMVTNKMKQREIVSDWFINDFSKININIMDSLRDFWPYGNGNPEPLFLFLWKLTQADIIWARNNTVKFKIRDENNIELDWIIFKYDLNDKMKEAVEWIIENKYRWEIWFLWKITKNNYKWIITMQIQIEDIII